MFQVGDFVRITATRCPQCRADHIGDGFSDRIVIGEFRHSPTDGRRQARATSSERQDNRGFGYHNCWYYLEDLQLMDDFVPRGGGCPRRRAQPAAV